MKSIVEIYLTHYNEYRKKYGKNTVVLMEVGQFYEMYSLNDNQYIDLEKIGMLLNLCIFKKKLDGLFYYGLGFPKQCSDKYYKKLIDDGKYVVVTIDKERINICGEYYRDNSEVDDNYIEEQEEILTITI